MGDKNNLKKTSIDREEGATGEDKGRHTVTQQEGQKAKTKKQKGQAR